MAAKHARMKKRSRVWARLGVVLGVALGVLAVLGAVFAASVGIGNFLLKKAEQFPAEGEREEITVPKQETVPLGAPSLKAHAYTLGARYSGFVYSGILQVCAPLRNADGSLNFDSRVCESVGWDQNGSVDLANNVRELHGSDVYLCTYIPITGFAVEDPVLSELTLSYEASLIAEAAECGVDEVFLTGLSPTQSNIEQIVAYVERVKLLCGADCAVGVMIPPEVFLSAEYDVYLAAALARTCDFLVMDLRDLPLADRESDGQESTAPSPTEPEQTTEQTTEQNAGQNAGQITVTFVIENMQYELQRYSPRLALTDLQTEALDLITARGYHNWLIMEADE